MTPKTSIQLAQLYSFSTRTLSNRLKAIDIELPARQLISAAKQVEIYAHPGLPTYLPEAEEKATGPVI